MKLFFSLFVLSSLPSSSLAFAPSSPAVAKTTSSTQMNAWGWSFGRKNKKASTIPEDDDVPKAEENGFTNTLLGDLEEEKDIEKETKHLLSRFGAKKTPKQVFEKSEADAKVDWEVKDDGIFGCLPTKEMTGVDPVMTQICSTISSQLYSSESAEDFKLSTKDVKTELFIYDNHGDYFDATPPFGVFITGKTMILGWRGTNSLFDGLNDAAASPQSSLAWRKHCKHIKAQGAMTSIVHNDIANHEKAIIKKAKEIGVTEIITTGQSLGGGSAQVAHLTLRAQIEDETSPWHELMGVNVRSVAFCGPMTTVLVGNPSVETDKFIEDLWNNSANIVYKNDVVPRGYGYLSFIEDFVDDAVDDIAKAIPLPKLLKSIIDVQGKLEDLVDDSTENESLAGLLGVLSQYRHIGNLVYYSAEDAEPIVLKDMGAFYKNTGKEKNTFRSVKYQPLKRGEDIVEEFMKWHMDPINAPGLSFPPEVLSK